MDRVIKLNIDGWGFVFDSSVFSDLMSLVLASDCFCIRDVCWSDSVLALLCVGQKVCWSYCVLV